MIYTVTEESLASLSACRADTKHNLNWGTLFVTPVWLRAWWDVFGEGETPLLRGVRQDDGEIIGIAPMMKKGDTALFAGGTDVCDYQDFITQPGKEDDFFNTLLDYLSEQNIKKLDLAHLRPDSAALESLAEIARRRGCTVEQAQEEVSLELELPPTWDGYLETLTTKQRHELRRKLRRLAEAGKVGYRFITEKTPAEGFMDTFLKMFSESREDKADFLTPRMETFFRRLAGVMADEGLLRMGVLELDARPIAAIMCFDYNGSVYLYNSGYDNGYDYLSAGLLSKALAIKDGIERRRRIFDFLKGAETYKYRLGGREVPLYRCRISING